MRSDSGSARKRPGRSEDFGLSNSTGPQGDEEPTVDELIRFALDDESQKRLWLRAIVPLLQLRSQDNDPSVRVQLALDLMYIAVCERVARIMGSDLPPECD